MQKTIDAISDILGKLLVVGISDPGRKVRLCVIQSAYRSGGAKMRFLVTGQSIRQVPGSVAPRELAFCGTQR